jgi:hypothetical protein
MCIDRLPIAETKATGPDDLVSAGSRYHSRSRITEGIEISAHLVFREHTLLAPFKAADEFYNSRQATRKMYQQLRTSVSAGAPVSAAEPVSADDLHLAQLRRRTIGWQWRARGAEESTMEPAGDKTKNLQMRITKARPRKRSSLLHNYMSSL